MDYSVGFFENGELVDQVEVTDGISEVVALSMAIKEMKVKEWILSDTHYITISKKENNE